jgi:hypothetical protein
VLCRPIHTELRLRLGADAARISAPLAALGLTTDFLAQRDLMPDLERTVVH